MFRLQFSTLFHVTRHHSPMLQYLALSLFALISVVAHGEDLKLGSTLCLSGAYASYGRHALQGMELAIEERNAAGGVNGRRIKLNVEDIGTYDLRAAVSATRKFLDVDHVDLMLPLIIEDSEVVVPLTSKKPVFSMAVGCGARRCGANLGPYHVRAPASHDLIIDRLFQYTQTLKPKQICVVAAEATYFESYGRYVEELSKNAGIPVSYESVPLSNTEDYRDVALRFKKQGCDAIYSWIAMGSVGPFFRRVRESGSQAQILSIVETDDPGLLKSAGDAANGAVFVRFSLGSAEFQRRYQERFHEAPARPAAPAYDGMKLLLDLVGEVGTAPKLLREAFSRVKDRPAANGTISYSADGERFGEDIELMQIRDGVPVLLH